LFFVFNQDTVGTSDTLFGEVHLGLSTIPVDSLYGIVFSINYDPVFIDTNSAHIDFSGGWVGDSSNTVRLVKYFYSDGKIDVGICRTNHTNISGFGRVAHLSIVAIDNIDGKTQQNVVASSFSFSNVHIITHSEALVDVFAKTDSFFITGINGPEGLNQEPVKLFPIPAAHFVEVSLPNNSYQSATIQDIFGREILQRNVSQERRVKISTENLYNGIYFLQLKTNDGSSVILKFLIAH